MLLTTQYLEEADLLSDNIIVIDKGAVIAEGTADELKARTGASFCEIVPSDLQQLAHAVHALGNLVPRDFRFDLAQESGRIAILPLLEPERSQKHYAVWTTREYR